jgi:hypothetical protein
MQELNNKTIKNSTESLSLKVSALYFIKTSQDGRLSEQIDKMIDYEEL